MTNNPETFKFENPDKLTNEEIKLLHELSEHPDKLKALDGTKLIKLKGDLEKEKYGYMGRVKNKASEKRIG
jgi:hypothetical protein